MQIIYNLIKNLYQVAWKLALWISKRNSSQITNSQEWVLSRQPKLFKTFTELLQNESKFFKEKMNWKNQDFYLKEKVLFSFKTLWSSFHRDDRIKPRWFLWKDNLSNPDSFLLYHKTFILIVLDRKP